jgi:hypothetical protein
MSRWNLLPVVLVAAIACGGEEAAEDPGAAQVDQQPPATQPSAETQAPAAGDPSAGAPAAQAPAQSTAPDAQAPARPAPQMPTVSMPAVDEPWSPTATGTVTPGMTREDVLGVWGEPVAERAVGAWTYLYFRNGCEVSCGTFDVVFLENGQVVNAIVRGQGHIYDGTSTSPPGAEARATLPPGGTEG